MACGILETTGTFALNLRRINAHFATRQRCVQGQQLHDPGADSGSHGSSYATLAGTYSQTVQRQVTESQVQPDELPVAEVQYLLLP